MRCHFHLNLHKEVPHETTAAPVADTTAPETTAGRARYLAIGATLDYFGYISREIVSPAYYEVALKTKYADDPQSGEMLDLIFDGVKIDAGVLYVLDLTVSVGPHQNLRELTKEAGGSAATTFARTNRMTEKKFDTLLKKLKAMQD